MKKFFITLYLVLFAIILFAQDSTVRWLQDYEIMKSYLTEGYANLDWIKKDDNVEILSLDKITKDQLAKAKSQTEVKSILDNFLLAFNDGHLELLEGNSQSSRDPVEINSNTLSSDLCALVGNEYITTNQFSLPFQKHNSFQLISTEEDPFPVGLIRLENGRQFAVLRISVFVPEFYKQTCEQVWELYRKNLVEECNSDCLEEFSIALANNLLEKLNQQLLKLEQYKFEALIIDIGDNGGGSEWAEALARTLSPKPLYASTFMLVKQPRSVEIFRNRLSEVELDLLRHDLNSKEKEILLTAKKRLEALINEAQITCDNTDFWTSNAHSQNCKNTTSSPFYASGVFPYLNVNDIQNLKSKSFLFSSSQYTYRESEYKGKIIVLVDRYTASAAEYFAAILKDNGVALVLGEKTYGAGGGFVDGGVDYVLPNTKFILKMPNCARLRKDGSNEFYGIESDIHVWDKDDDVDTRLRKVLSVLERIDF